MNRLARETDDLSLESWNHLDQDAADALSKAGHVVWLEATRWHHDPKKCPECKERHLEHVHKRFLAALREARERRDRQGHPWD